ncbi:MAG: ATP-binding cassette domain-containing protein, partial [Pseudomonadales bacterium]|nr:ATP-binding cassette domain-containing protein [Pseudomonadales bacterium]
PGQLSGGQEQRVAIARAIVNDPAIIIADEPTGNLDANNAQRVSDLLMREVRELGSVLVIATHNEAIAASADRVLRLGA